ncbi:MAG TPA: Hsp20/alpha crystallin family protein [Caulobacteraceae bacterium]
MAEPTPNTETPRRGDGAPNSATGSPAGEPRSFDARRMPPIPDADTLAEAAQPLVEGGRQLAEQGRRAGQHMASAWRQAADPLIAMQYDMGRWFDDVFRQTFGFLATPGARPMGHFSPASLFGLPPAELKETATAQTLAIELPGLKREDIDISLQGDNLVITGHKTEETEDAGAAYRVSERRYGRFERLFPLPPEVERDKIEAAFKDGVLKITLPKTAPAPANHQRIEIRG